MDDGEPPIFIDADGEPLRFFLPMSLVARSSFKQKIEDNGGVLVQSELMPNIIKIGDPAKPQSYDASWLNFRYIQDAIRDGHLQDPQWYVMDNPGQTKQDDVQNDLSSQIMPTTQRQTPFGGGLSTGVGTRGTRQEFTPDEDEVLRRIVHRPGVASSGNKVYKLIAEQYGGHSFHSWRDRYIRHLRPIWGPPTEEDTLDVQDLDDEIITQSFRRRAHNGPEYRASVARTETARPGPRTEALRSADVSAASKKPRIAFSSTDDEILLRAVAEHGENVQVFRSLARRHPHHTWESWKNRVKAIKKNYGGALPDYTRELSPIDASDAELEEDEPSPHVKSNGNPGQSNDNGSSAHVRKQLDIMEDDVQRAFEQQQGSAEGGIDKDIDMQQQLQQEDLGASPFTVPSTTEDPQQTEEGFDEIQTLEPQQHVKERPDNKTRRRQINIHDPNVDENLGRVSDIEDANETQSRGKKRSKAAPAMKQSNATIQTASERTTRQRTAKAVPMTPSRQIEHQTPSQVKSAKLEHHERDKPGLVPAVREHAAQDFLVEIAAPRTRAAKARAASQEPQAAPAAAPTKHGKGNKWQAIQDGAKSTDTFILDDEEMKEADGSEDDAAAEEQIKQSAAKQPLRTRKKSTVKTMPLIDEDGFLQSNASQQASAMQTPRGQRRRQTRGEVHATPDSSPMRPPVSQLRGNPSSPTYSTAFDAPSPTPTSPNQSFSQSQFLQDTQAIRGEVDFDFDTSVVLDVDTQEQELQEQLQAEAEQRKQNWISRQATHHRIPHADAEDAWDRTCGVQSLAMKVVEAYQQGRSPPRMPGIWTDEDDNVIRSTDAHALEALDEFHKGAVEQRLLYLDALQ